MLSAKMYIKNICEKVERIFEIALRNYHLPLEGGYHPKLDSSDLLQGDEISKYRMLIGSLNWAVMLGRVDVMFASITLARYSQAPRKEHLKTTLQALGYLKNHTKGCICFDTSFREEPEDVKVKRGWRDLYPLAKEKLPDEPPEP